MMQIEKTQVALRFTQAGQSYHEHAVVQKQIAQQLMTLIVQFLMARQQAHVFEIGCGTGHLTRLFEQHYQVQNFHLNDLCSSVQSHFNDAVHYEWCLGDAEQIDYPQDVDVVISSSALQWMTDLDHVFDKCQKALKTHGLLCVSSFGQDNLKEIKSLTHQGLTYRDLASVEQSLVDAGFEILHLSERRQQLPFSHPKDVLRHLKATGVTGTAGHFRWSKQSLLDFCQGYRQFVTTDEHEHLIYPLTYHPMFIIARKKA